MPTDIDAQVAFQRLLDTLTKMNLGDLVSDIQKVVATGKLAEVKGQRGKFEEARKAYAPGDAYIVGVRLLLAAIDPILMAEDAHQYLANLEGGEVKVEWQPDYLEGAQPSPEALEVSAMPSINHDELKRIREVAVSVLALMNEIELER